MFRFTILAALLTVVLASALTVGCDKSNGTQSLGGNTRPEDAHRGMTPITPKQPGATPQ